MIHITLHSLADAHAMRARIVALATVLGWIALGALIGSMYVGHSTSPYGTCSAPSGRSVPCALLRR
jgi:hypothetical protein